MYRVRSDTHQWAYSEQDFSVALALAVDIAANQGQAAVVVEVLAIEALKLTAERTIFKAAPQEGKCAIVQWVQEDWRLVK